MPPVTELTRVLRGGERASPKTVLGFFGAMTAIAASLVVAVVAFLADKPTLHYLIPIILIVFGLVFVGLLVAVIVIASKDPSKLMLGQITGREFAIIQRLTQGDSSAGEHVDKLIVGIDGFVTSDEVDSIKTEAPKELPSVAKDDAGDI